MHVGLLVFGSLIPALWIGCLLAIDVRSVDPEMLAIAVSSIVVNFINSRKRETLSEKLFNQALQAEFKRRVSLELTGQMIAVWGEISGAAETEDLGVYKQRLDLLLVKLHEYLRCA